MNKDIEGIRALVNGKQPQTDISEMLYKHKCFYLFSKIQSKSPYTNHFQTKNALNKLCVIQRFQTCAALFQKFEEENIPYAAMKGAILSTAAYNDPYCRHSSDVDLLIDRKSIDVVKKQLWEAGFVQGRVTENGIEPFSRKELLFQASMTHQAAPFVKEANSKLCTYVNIDINFDIIWGENKKKSDMKFVLQNTQDTVICDTHVKKLRPEMEFIALCLHHYKDMNSLYMLWRGSLKLSLFCDIYFYLKNCSIDPEILYINCHKLDVSKYVYYCLHYTNLIFEDRQLQEYMALLYSENAEPLIHTFGLADKERQPWNVDFFTRLFDIKMSDYFDKTLSADLLNKIKTNRIFMQKIEA